MEINYCFQCGTEVISEDDRFCRSCGVKLTIPGEENKSEDRTNRTSRRKFLKKAAGSAAGMGALGLLSRPVVAQQDREVRKFNAGSISTDHLEFSKGRVEIGTGANADKGKEANGTQRRPVAIGYDATAKQLQSIAIGAMSTANQDDTIALGMGATADVHNGHAIGEGAHASAAYSLTVGKGSSVNYGSHDPDAIGDFGAIAIGMNLDPSTRSDASDMSGEDPVARGERAVAIGSPAECRRDADRSVAVGSETNVFGNSDAVALGFGSEVTAPAAVAIGTNASVDTSKVTRISGDQKQLVFAASKDTISDDGLNPGELTIELDEENSGFRLRGKDSDGTVREAIIPW